MVADKKTKINMENSKNLGAKKKMLPLIGVAVLLLVLVGIVILTKNKTTQPPIEQPTTTETEQQTTASSTATTTDVLAVAPELVAANPTLVDAKREAPGSNLITKEGKVVTDTGAQVKNDVSPMAAEAPHQTLPITKDQVSANAVKIDISAAGYSPSEFRVKKGQAVTIALSSVDSYVHMLKFEDPSLVAVGTSISAGTTRAISFNAPTTAGEYKFFCDIPGHADRGEVGKMIVE
jgi:plastocyanin